MGVEDSLSGAKTVCQRECECRRATFHTRSRNRRSSDASSALKRSCSTGFVVRQSAVDKIIEATRMKIGLQLFINRLRVLPIKPQ